MKVDSKEISTYIKAVIEGIDTGLPKGYFVSSDITIDIGLRNESKKKGEVKVYVAGAGGEHSKEENARVTFHIKNPMALAELAEAAKYAAQLVEGGDMTESLGLRTIVEPSKKR